MHAGPHEIFPSFDLKEEPHLEEGELAEEQLVEELEVEAGLTLYMALCGGFFLLVSLFIVTACMCIR